VQHYGPELEQRLRRHLKPTNKSWRVDETYVRVKGRWCYLYRAIDSAGATIDFPLSTLRDADAAKRLFRNVSLANYKMGGKTALLRYYGPGRGRLIR
jgi:IS6 family transposase